MKKSWTKLPNIPNSHLTGAVLEKLERRRRHRQVRYLLFRLQNQVQKSAPLDAIDVPPGFVAFWLGEKPRYMVDAKGRKMEPPKHRTRPVAELGSYESFAKVWDVDEDLNVYLRHMSVWREWDLKLQRVTPVLGE